MTEMERIADDYLQADFHVQGQSERFASERNIKAALREFGELACKAVCEGCRQGFDADSSGYHYPRGQAKLCKASAIRKLMATEIERG